MENRTMKNIFKVTALACLMAASNAVAGPSANVQVKGTVKMGACIPTFSNGGIVDLGTTGVDQISTSGFSFPRKTFDLIINCTSASMIEFSYTDNRADTANRGSFPNIAGGAVNNGLGMTTKGEKIGAFTFAMYKTDGTVIVDGKSKRLIYRPTGATNWGAFPPSGWTTVTADIYQISIAESGGLEPTPIQNATFNVGVLPYISASVRGIDDIENIDGNLTFNINYL